MQHHCREFLVCSPPSTIEHNVFTAAMVLWRLIGAIQWTTDTAKFSVNPTIFGAAGVCPRTIDQHKMILSGLGHSVPFTLFNCVNGLDRVPILDVKSQLSHQLFLIIVGFFLALEDNALIGSHGGEVSVFVAVSHL